MLLTYMMTWIVPSYLKTSRRRTQHCSFHLCLREATLICKKFLDLHTSSTESSSNVNRKHHLCILLLLTMKLSSFPGILCRIKLKIWRKVEVAKRILMPLVSLLSWNQRFFLKKQSLHLVMISSERPFPVQRMKPSNWLIRVHKETLGMGGLKERQIPILWLIRGDWSSRAAWYGSIILAKAYNEYALCLLHFFSCAVSRSRETRLLDCCKIK